MRSWRSRWLLAFSAFSSLLLFSGCMELSSRQDYGATEIRKDYRAIQISPHDYETIEHRQAGPAANEAAPPLDGLAPAEIPIDLPTVLRLAGTDALEVRLAGERVNEARGRTLAADMQFLPSISPAFVNRWHNGRAQTVQGTFIEVDKQSSLQGVGAAADWRLGESVFQSLAARKRQEASENNARATADDSRIRAANAFFNLVLARADLAIVDDRLKQADETVRLTEELQKGGAALLSEVRRSQATRAEIKQRRAGAKERVRTASLNLTEALHIDPLVTLTPQQEPQDMVALIPAEKTLPDLVSDAISRRPELSESRAFWNALDKERRASLIAPLIPTIHADAFGGSLGRHPSDAHGTADYTLGLQWKIGVGGIGDVSRTRIAEAQQRQEEIRFARVADRVAREVVENKTHLETTREQIDLSKEEIAAADEALRLSSERLKAGSALTIEVLAAEDALFGAKSRAAQSVTEFNKAQYGLLRSIGGFRASDDTVGNQDVTAPARSEPKP